ncbi:MAG: calcium-binding protein [Cyanobacteria bacterium P01_A01_bin.37]
MTAEITDDDDVQVVITPILIEATEGGGNGGYLVRLSTIPTNPVTIAFDTGNQVEAIAPLTFAADATAFTDQTVTLIATDDDLVEGDHEQIISHTVTSADSAYAALSVDSVTTALIDNDIDYSLAVDTTSLSEGEDDSQAITVTVTRSGDVSGTSSIDLTLSGTATVDSDYSSSASSNTLSFATGETSQIMTLTLLGDIDEEVDETIILNLENGTAPGTATLTDETATITLLNDDASLGIALSDIDFSNNNPGINLRGTSQNDKLRGTPQSDTIRGGRGNDRITSGRQSASFGKDRLFGNAGNDVISGGKGQDRLDGGSGNDRLKGGNNRDLLLGGSGDDRLLGQQGSDILVGGRGDDVIKGGSGIDMIRYTSLNDGQDIIKGFNGDEDLIDLRDIFSLPAFTETSPFKQFQQYVELVQVGSDIDIKVDEDGRGTGTTFTTLATLRNVAIDNISSRNIVIV